MKKIFLLCLLISTYIIIPKNASAQYKSVFGDSSTKWVAIPRAFCDIEKEVIFENKFYYENDTINGLIYKQVLSLQNEMQQVKEYLREDTLTGRIWHRPVEDSMEYLVMDLSLSVGDTFKVISGGGKPLLFIADSVFYLEGLKHIRFNTSIIFCGPIDESLTFIEGVGTNAGIFYGRKWDANGPNSYLLCLYKNDIKIAGNRRYNNSCSTPNGVEEKSKVISNINPYPNPTNGSGIITFENENNACVNLEIYDLNGKRIFTNSSKTPYLTFDLNAFENGVYIYKLVNETGEFSSGKIIKN